MSDVALRPGEPLLFEPPRAARPAAFRRLGLVAFVTAYRLVAGVLIAGPFAVLLHGAVAHDPRGDAALFDPGAAMLFEALRMAARGAAGASAASGPIALFATFLGIFPFAALIAGLGRQGRLSLAYLAARAVRPIGTLALLWGFGLVAQVALAAIFGLLGAKVVGKLHLTPRGDDLGGVVVAAGVLLVVLAAGVVRDLAAVAAVNDGSRFYTSVKRALGVLRRAGQRAFLAYAWRGVLAVAAIVAAAVAVSFLSRGSSDPVAIPFLIHQAAIAFTVFLHASWLAASIRLLDRFAPLAVASAPISVPPPAPVAVPEPAPANAPPESVRPPPSAPPAPPEAEAKPE